MLEGAPARGDRVFLPVERVVYRVIGVDPAREQRWTVYALSLLAFSGISVLGLFLLQRFQGSLFLNPTDMVGVPPALAFNTAASFVTNTNWQNYGGESTMSHLTQMSGLAVQNFVSAAVGIAVAVALIRGFTRRRSDTIGNFWVDITRVTTRVLLPLAVVVALVLVSQGVVQNLAGFTEATTVEGAPQSIPGGPIASQEAIKELGTNGGGPYNAQLGAPVREPERLHEPPRDVGAPRDPVRAHVRVRPAGRRPAPGLGALRGDVRALDRVGRHRDGLRGRRQPGGRGARHDRRRQLRGQGGALRPAASGLFAASTTGTSTGAVIAAHDSFTPLGGAVPLVNMMLGEVSPGGVGAGLYGMLIFALLAVFIAGLMVGRTPEYLGKKIQATEMKLVVLYLLIVPTLILVFASLSVVSTSPKSSILNPGPHGLSEVVYAFTSAANNNGSAFGGLTGNTDWYNTTLGLAMLAGRFLPIVLVLAIAGALARKQPVPVTAGTFPTGTPLFAGLLVGVILIMVGLTYFPVLALGPILEQLGL